MSMKVIGNLATENRYRKTDCGRRRKRQNELMEARPKQPHLRIVSFALHSARRLSRDPSARRWTMFVVLTLAMVLLLAATTFLQPSLPPREHPGGFIFLWLLRAWS